jgi:hypothetical protein
MPTPKLPTKVTDRIAAGLKRFIPVLEAAKSRDINETDTVTIVKDILEAIMGFDKYEEITSEHAIRGTYCDLAIKLDGHLSLLIEVKAIGMSLKDMHVKQAVDYAANQGCEWVVLTNGIVWHAYRVAFAKPITNTLVLDIALTALSPRKADDLARLWLISKEGLQKSGLADYHAQREALSRYTLGALLLTDTVVEVLRRELRRVTPDAKIDSEEIRTAISDEVVKREVLEGDRAEAARKLVNRAANRTLRAPSTKVAEIESAEP